MAYLSMFIKIFVLSLLGLQVAAALNKAPLIQTILPRHLEAPDLIDPDLFDAQYCFDGNGHESNEDSVLWASHEFCTKEVINHQEEPIPARPVEAYYTIDKHLYLVSLLQTISSLFGISLVVTMHVVGMSWEEDMSCIWTLTRGWKS